jgi:hypothetical protein
MGVLAGALLLTYGVMSLIELHSVPEAFARFPGFILAMTVLFPLKVWERLRAFGVGDVLGTVPGVGAFALLAIVLVLPGTLGRGVVATARAILLALRRGEAGERTPRRQWGTTLLLVLFVGILIGLLQRRFAEGMLTRQSLALVGHALLRFAALPLLLTLPVLRSRPFQRLLSAAVEPR